MTPDERNIRDWIWWAEYRGGSSYTEIAERHGVTYAHVYQRVAKVRRRLKYPPLRALFGPEISR